MDDLMLIINCFRYAIAAALLFIFTASLSACSMSVSSRGFVVEPTSRTQEYYNETPELAHTDKHTDRERQQLANVISRGGRY